MAEGGYETQPALAPHRQSHMRRKDPKGLADMKKAPSCDGEPFILKKFDVLRQSSGVVHHAIRDRHIEFGIEPSQCLDPSQHSWVWIVNVDVAFGNSR